MLSVIRIARALWGHPFARRHLLSTLARFIRWQVSSRIAFGPTVVPFVGPTRLVIGRGMHAATTNIYAGLQEFWEMAFVAHALRAEDVFVDVGANVGAYTVMAAGLCHARVLSFEPVPATYRTLCDNVRINNLTDRVETFNEAVGASVGHVLITQEFGAMNHVVDSNYACPRSRSTSLTTLDTVCQSSTATFLKIDVEGYELEVLKGARLLLQQQQLFGLLLELNSNASHYGVKRRDVVALLVEMGFSAYSYNPWSRAISPCDIPEQGTRNVLFLRDIEKVARRVQGATSFEVMGMNI